MSAVDLRCINCDVRLSRLRRHVLSAEDDNLVTTIHRWTYPRDSTETDCICHACWELANYQLLHGNGQAHSSQQVGHQCLCINCGRSILRAHKRQVVRPNASEEERMIAAIISTWIHPRQLTSVDQACVPCWLRAQRASRRGHLSGLSNINQPLQSEDANNSPGLSLPVNVHPDSPEFQESNLANDDDNHIACINCDMHTSQATGHCLSTVNENLVAIIKLWIFPRAINTSDYICNSCWVIGMHQLQHTCIVCGTSMIETESHIINHASEEETQIVAIINQRIQPRQVFRTLNELDYACNVDIVTQHEHQIFLVVVIKFPTSISKNCHANGDAFNVIKKNRCLRLCDLIGSRDMLSSYFVITVKGRIRFRFLSNSSINSDINANLYQVTATAARLQPPTKCNLRNETLCEIDQQDFCFTNGVVCDGIKNCGVSDWFDERKSECSLPIEYLGYAPVIAVVGALVCALLAGGHILMRCLPPLAKSFFIFNANEDNRLCIDPMFESPVREPFEVDRAKRKSLIPVSSSSSSEELEVIEYDEIKINSQQLEQDVPSSNLSANDTQQGVKRKSTMKSMTAKFQQKIRSVTGRGKITSASLTASDVVTVDVENL